MVEMLEPHHDEHEIDGLLGAEEEEATRTQSIASGSAFLPPLTLPPSTTAPTSSSLPPRQPPNHNSPLPSTDSSVASVERPRISLDQLASREQNRVSLPPSFVSNRRVCASVSSKPIFFSLSDVPFLFIDVVLQPERRPRATTASWSESSESPEIVRRESNSPSNSDNSQQDDDKNENEEGEGGEDEEEADVPEDEDVSSLDVSLPNSSSQKRDVGG